MHRRNFLAAAATVALPTAAVAATVSLYAADVAAIQALADKVAALCEDCSRCRAVYEAGGDQDCEAWTLASDELLRAQVEFTRAKAALHQRVMTDAGIPTF